MKIAAPATPSAPSATAATMISAAIAISSSTTTAATATVAAAATPLRLLLAWLSSAARHHLIGQEKWVEPERAVLGPGCNLPI